jgi:hypothetical protein
MKTIKIYIFDSEKIDENESVGFRVNKDTVRLVDFHFDETQLSGYWIDPDVNDDTGNQDIIFYVGGETFKTKWNPQNEELLRGCLKLGL